MEKKGTVLGGSLMIAGTTIGGGMLALPVLTSLGGFYPSLALYVCCWLFMLATGLLFLEVCLWMGGESNIVSMAGKTLGAPGRWFAWFTYLFFFYCVTLAYLVGGGNLLVSAFGEQFPNWVGSCLFILLFAPFVFAGAWYVDKVNVFLMFGLIATYFLFVVTGFRYVNPSYFQHMDWPLSLRALPVAFAAFGFQGIVPTIVHYLDHDVKKMRLSIIIGATIPFVTYVIWQWLILGIVPAEGPHSLMEALKNGDNAVHPLRYVLENKMVFTMGEFFAFFALATSLFGVTLGMLDFLADGLSIKKTTGGKLFLCALIFIPPLIFSITYPHVFLTALDYAGGFGSALLLGLLPILMVWSGRYVKGLKSEYALWGGRAMLVVLLLFVLFELGSETVKVLSKLFGEGHVVGGEAF